MLGYLRRIDLRWKSRIVLCQHAPHIALKWKSMFFHCPIICTLSRKQRFRYTSDQWIGKVGAGHVRKRHVGAKADTTSTVKRITPPAVREVGHYFRIWDHRELPISTCLPWQMVHILAPLLSFIFHERDQKRVKHSEVRPHHGIRRKVPCAQAVMQNPSAVNTTALTAIPYARDMTPHARIMLSV